MSDSLPASFAVDADATTSGRRMWAVGAAAAVVSALVVIVFVAIAKAADVPMEVAENSTKQPEQIPLAGYATVILVSTLIGLLLATAFARWAPRPRLTFVIVAVVLTVVSLAFPLTTEATTATKVILEITHLIPAALIIPAIAAQLPMRRLRAGAA
jgi:magnesium-transporting ATPase (P-type)